MSKNKTLNIISPIFKKVKIAQHSIDLEKKSENLMSILEENVLNIKPTNPPLKETENSSFNSFSNTSTLTGYSKIQELKLVKIGIASSEQIIDWAEKTLPNGKVFGEVLNPNTLHYKTFKPQKGGLFCQRIFGPLKDFECACGIVRKPLIEENSPNVEQPSDQVQENLPWMPTLASQTAAQSLLSEHKPKRTFCSICDVEYTWSVIRRYQLGYIQLVSPVTHLWYLKANPSYLSMLLDIRKKELEDIIYCSKIITLEDYWRPRGIDYSSQIHLNAAILFESYKKQLSFNEKVEENKNNSLLIGHKNQKEIKKRQQLKVYRQGIYYFFQNHSEEFSEPENRQQISWNDQIKSLEKAYTLSSSDFDPRKFAKISKMAALLTEKKMKALKKDFFFSAKNQLFDQFYKKYYRTISIRSYSFFSLFVESTKRHSPNNEIIKVETLKHLNSSTNNLKKVVKDYFFYKQNKKTTQVQRSTNKKTFSTFANWKTPNFYSYYLTKEKILNRDLENFDKEDRKVKNVFLRSFLHLIRKSFFQESWESIYGNKFLGLCLFCPNQDREISKNLDLNFLKKGFNEILSNCLILYLLFVVQKTTKAESRSSTLKSKPRLKLEFFEGIKIILLNWFLFRYQNFENDFKKYDSLQELLVIEPFFEITENRLKFFETQQAIKNPNFLKFQDVVIQFILKTYLLENSHSILASKVFMGSRTVIPSKKKIFKIFLFNKNEQEKFWSTDEAAQVTGVEIELFNSLKGKQKLKTLKEKFEKPLFSLSNQKKIYQFLKNSSTYPKEGVAYLKNLINLRRNLKTFKEKKLSPAFQLFNNLYTVSYSEGWQSDKDWKYFLYYNTAPVEISDKPINIYTLRFFEFPKTNNQVYLHKTPVPIIGANILQKLLFQYEGVELKKMSQQHQNVLPKLNRYIRYRKQIARKKTELSEVQRLLQTRDDFIRRLKLLRKLFKKKTKTSSMILSTVPVLPPDLRPILKMQNQSAASDLNRFYQRILYRNDRLKKFIRANSAMMNTEPAFEVKYAQRLLQEAVDNLIQNGKGQVKPETNSRGQPLKSLSEILKGKQGRFRQYLLGKRVDYSGRSVIVVGPTLNIYECGLPFEMAMELFLPFLIKRIFQYQMARTVMGAKTIVKNERKITWHLLEEIMQQHPIMLNRAPTLHRLGIQAFRPKLIEGRAILLHPLVCPAFNADFDGDQMAVHVPITVEARTEAWKLMFSRNHLISPATGEPMLLPTQDMVLGCYYLTTNSFQFPKFHSSYPFELGTGFYFSNMNQILQAYLQEKIHLQTHVWIRWDGIVQLEQELSQPLEIRVYSPGSWIEIHSNFHKSVHEKGKGTQLFVRTTAGRILFNLMVENCLQTKN